jgi:hypothetical protein
VISTPEVSAQAYDTPKSGTLLQDRQVDVLRITPRATFNGAARWAFWITSAARGAYYSPALGFWQMATSYPREGPTNGSCLEANKRPPWSLSQSGLFWGVG